VDAAPLARLVVVIIVGGAMYVGVIGWKQRDLAVELRNILRRRVSSSPADERP